MNKPTIFFDLDGTILDVSERIYRIYTIILKKYNKKLLSKKEYISLKQEKKSILEILTKTGASDLLSKFKKEWADNIEKEEFLALDKLPLLAKDFLLKTRRKNIIVLITLRDNPKSLLKELEQHKIDKIFEKILISSGKGFKDKWKIKKKLIKKYGNSRGSIIIGDTETDILAGKNLGLKTIAVTSGMRSHKYLKKYEPDYLVKKIWKIKI